MPASRSVSNISRATPGSSQELKNVVLRIIAVQPVEASARTSSSTIALAVIGSTGLPPSADGT